MCLIYKLKLEIERSLLMMGLLFATRVILGKTEFNAVPAKLKAQVADILINECGLPELVPAEYGGTADITEEEERRNTMATYKRIASDGKPIEVTDTPAGLSESAGIRNSIKQPVMRRDLERAGTEICVLPQYKLTYDENGYCVKKEKCRIPDDIAAKLAEMNK